MEWDHWTEEVGDCFELRLTLEKVDVGVLLAPRMDKCSRKATRTAAAAIGVVAAMQDLVQLNDVGVFVVEMLVVGLLVAGVTDTLRLDLKGDQRRLE